MTIKVNDANNKAYEIDLKTDKTLEFNDPQFKELATALGLDAASLSQILEGAKYSDGDNIPLDIFISKAVDKVPEDDPGVADVLEKLSEIKEKIGIVDKRISELMAKKEEVANNPKGATKFTTEDEAELANAKKLKNALEAEKVDAENKLSQASSQKGVTPKGKADINSYFSKGDSGAAQKAAVAPGESSPSTTTPFSSGAGTGGGGAAQKAASDGKAGMGTDPYAGFGAGYKAGIGPGDGSAMFYTGIGDDFINDSWDMINESQKRQKMLMLFFYYAKLAMSGDIGAMYQFMRFLAHVIGRDKALQNVWMGTKLLELQDASREATKELLATDVNGDENGAWTKKLQEIKGEEGMIATSQKLITQMMEEFTQIVETLTNVQKSLLDVNGKVLSNLSQWR